MADNLLLEVKALKKYFPIQGGFWRRTVGYVKAVDGIDFAINEGETFGLVGESGCGKSTTGRSVIRLIQPTSGEVSFKDPNMGWVSIPKLKPHELKMARQNMQIIFQDPYSSLDPRMTVGETIAEPLQIQNKLPGSEIKRRVAELLEVVGMSPDYASRYPHAFSGGQRQRIGIARALSNNPKLIVCDEPVSALDVSIQAQVLNLLVDLQREFHLTYLFIAHDLSVVEHICDRVAVMYVGYLVEMGTTEQIFINPRHPYTEALLSSIPKADPLMKENPIKLPGDVPSPANPPSGCYFHPRCRFVADICRKERPRLRDAGDGRQVACHLSDQLHLQGASNPRLVTYQFPNPLDFPKQTLVKS